MYFALPGHGSIEYSAIPRLMGKDVLNRIKINIQGTEDNKWNEMSQ